jgi:hypothetical protein
MIKVSILYPYRENGKFDVEYYCRTHMPLAAGLFGAAPKGSSVDIGINAGPPGTPPTRCSPIFRTTPTAVTARS